MHNPACFARHIGPWLLVPSTLVQAVDAIRSGLWKPTAAVDEKETQLWAGKIVRDETGPDATGYRLYTVTDEGAAIIAMEGPMMKGDSKFGGTNTIRTRKAIRTATADPDVKGIMLWADTPGGHVAGTMELANDIRAARKAKPVHVHADDLLASAGYWAASQADRISVNPIGQVGSIGVVAVVEDSSKAAEMAGIKVHVVSTGPHKGRFTPGAPVTEEHLAELQRTVDGINSFFLAAVEKGRGLTPAKVQAVADGRVFFAKEALELGLVDAVQSFEKSLADLGAAWRARATAARQSRERVQLDLDLEMESI